MEKTVIREKIKTFFIETGDIKAAVPIVVLWVVTWLSYFNFLISPYSDVILAVSAAYSLFLSIKRKGVKKQIPALIFILLYIGFGILSYIYNKNAGIYGLVMPAVFGCFSVLLMNVRLRDKITCALSYLSCLIWFISSLCVMFSNSGGLPETILNTGFANVLLFFFIYAVSAYRAHDHVSPYPAVCIFICSCLLLCREGVAIFAVITVAFLIFDFQGGRTVARNHPRLIKRVRSILHACFSRSHRTALFMFIGATVFILLIIYFINISSSGLVQIPNNGILGGKLMKDAISNTFISPSALFLGAKSVYLPSMLKNSDVIVSSFFKLHSNYGLGMFVTVLFYAMLSCYHYIKSRNYLFLTLTGAMMVRMLFDNASFPGVIDTAMLFLFVYPFFEPSVRESHPPVLSSCRACAGDVHNRFYFYICILLTTVFMLKLYAPRAMVLDVIALMCCALLVFNPLYTVVPLLITNFFYQAFYINRVPYAIILSGVFILGLLFHTYRMKKRIPKKMIFAAMAAGCWIVASSLFGFTHDIVYAGVMCVNIVFLLFMAYYTAERGSIRWMFRALVFSCVIMLVTVFVLYLFGGGYFREGHFTINAQINPNTLAKSLEQITAIFFSGVLIFRKTLYKVVCAAFMLLAVFLIFLSGSRSALISVVLGIIAVMVIYSFVSNFKTRKTECGIILTLIILGILTYLVMWLTNSDMIHRFTINSVLSSGGTGRTEIWKGLIATVIPKNLFFGVGFGEENVFTAMKVYGLAKANYSHNLILGTVAQLGIVGATAFFSALTAMLVRIIKKRNCNRYMPLYISMIAFALMNGVGEHILDFQSMWIAFACALFLANLSELDKESRPHELRYWGVF